MKNIEHDKIKTILVTRADRIGDVILSTPVFKALKEKFPQASLLVLVLPTARAIVAGNPYIDKIIMYDKQGKHKGIWQTVRFALALQKEDIDVVIHLHPTNRVHVISFIARIPVRIGYRKKCGSLLTHSIEERKWEGIKHEAAYNFDLLEFLDIPPEQQKGPFLLIGKKDEAALDTLLTSLEVKLGTFVVLAPGASCRSKMWPLERFAKLADIIHEKYKIEIVLIGSKQDKKTAEKIIHHARTKMINLAGLTSLKTLGALFKRTKMLISNDSGPVHLAASLGTPVISLFGRNDKGLSPARWRPLGSQSFFIHKDVGCIRCLAHYCEKDFICLQAITVDDVLTIIEKNFTSILP